jgi:H/ACA ribonucleoprotein complex subunit 4
MKEARLPYDVKRQLLDKSHDVTDDKHGCTPSNRPINEYVSKGVINLDKPAGPTSHEVVAWVKRIFGIEKAGHGGTLEPLECLTARRVAK